MINNNELSKNEQLFMDEIFNRGYVIKMEYLLDSLECVDECTACDDDPMTISEYADYMLKECDYMFETK